VPDDDALDIAYDHFARALRRLFLPARLGAEQVRVHLLCDPWLRKTPLDGFERRDDWKICSVQPRGDIEESPN